MTEKPISRRQWLFERLYEQCATDNIPVSPMMAQEAVYSTALSHPEWDMDEEKTREEWSRADPGP